MSYEGMRAISILIRCEVFCGGEIQVFAVSHVVVAQPEAGAALEHKPLEPARGVKCGEDVVMQELFLNNGQQGV